RDGGWGGRGRVTRREFLIRNGGGRRGEGLGLWRGGPRGAARRRGHRRLDGRARRRRDGGGVGGGVGGGGGARGDRAVRGDGGVGAALAAHVDDDAGARGRGATGPRDDVVAVERGDRAGRHAAATVDALARRGGDCVMAQAQIEVLLDPRARGVGV